MAGPSPDADKALNTPLGMYDRPSRPQITGIELTAIVLSVLWLAGAVVFLFVVPAGGGGLDGLRFIITLLAIFLPVAMIWVAATAARASRVMRQESHRLQTAIDAIRQAQIAQQQRGAMQQDASVTKKLEEIAETARKTEAALAVFHSSRAVEATRQVVQQAAALEPEGGDQGALELGTPAEALSPPLPQADFIRALHFPETAEDEAGFAALRRALKDRKAAQLIQAAQDVLTLLSQDGIYMDDLSPDRARPEGLAPVRPGHARPRGGGAGGRARPLVAGAERGADEAGPDLSRCGAPLPASVRPILCGVRGKGQRRGNQRAGRDPDGACLHAAGPGGGHFRLIADREETDRHNVPCFSAGSSSKGPPLNEMVHPVSITSQTRLRGVARRIPSEGSTLGRPLQAIGFGCSLTLASLPIYMLWPIIGAVETLDRLQVGKA